MTSLLKLQQCFSAGITGGDTGILDLLQDTNPKFTPSQRIESYRYGIAVRFEDSLIEDFPLLTKALGEDLFKKTIADYLTKYPSRTYNLAELGMRLPAYFENYPLEGHSYAESLAKFEIEILYADNSDQNPEALPIENIGSEDLSLVRLIFDKSVRLYSSDWAILENPIIERQCYYLIHETDFLVQPMELTRDMFLVAKKLIEGQPLPQATDHLENDQALAVSVFFSNLVKLQITIGFEQIR